MKAAKIIFCVHGSFVLSGDCVKHYTDPLPEGITLAAFDKEQLIFANGGKWLHPLFALEKFLSTYEGSREHLSAHDTAAGKAAAVLMARMGIKRAHIDLVSDLAASVYEEHAIELSWGRRIERLKCKTEDILASMDDEDEMYRMLRRRAKLVRGMEVAINDLSFRYPTSDAIIEELSFSVEEGGRLIIQGDNGMGKTTLLNLLMGTLRPSSGSILIDGMAPSQLPKRSIGYIKQQQTQQQFAVSALEVVSMGVDPSLPVNEQRWEIDTALRRTGAQDLAKRNFFTLSGGERQKVSIARTLCQKARLLLLDEPTSFLDVKSRENLVEVLASLSVTEMPTIIIVTHDKELPAILNWPTLTLGKSYG